MDLTIKTFEKGIILRYETLEAIRWRVKGDSW